MDCGIYLRSGRPILSFQGLDEDDIHTKTEGVIRVLSWLLPVGIYPVYSDAIGKSRPYVTWAIAAMTILISLAFWVTNGYDLSNPSSLDSLMLWSGRPLVIEDPAEGPPASEPAPAAAANGEGPKVNAQELPAELNQRMGRFHAYQLVTHAFLHADIMHLAGNLLFLLVLGTRVNEAIGNIATAVLYPLLAVAAGMAHVWSTAAGPLHPMIGASGAVMGMAGLYLILFPVHRVYIAAWWRWGLLVGFRLSHKVFSLRGFIVVLFFAALDVGFTALGAKDNVAHWAHLGGIMSGAAIAILLLACRLVYSRCDLFSIVLGRYAWAITGTPAAHREK